MPRVSPVPMPCYRPGACRGLDWWPVSCVHESRPMARSEAIHLPSRQLHRRCRNRPWRRGAFSARIQIHADWRPAHAHSRVHQNLRADAPSPVRPTHLKKETSARGVAEKQCANNDDAWTVASCLFGPRRRVSRTGYRHGGCPWIRRAVLHDPRLRSYIPYW